LFSTQTADCATGSFQFVFFVWPRVHWRRIVGRDQYRVVVDSA
jgi:hypothetical protein